ncbi:MAG: hypothetical protein ACRDRL_05315 [Sciscionella sp.]
MSKVIRASDAFRKADFGVPEEFYLRFRKFVLDHGTGTVSWNIRNGEILGLTINEQVRLSEAPKI